MRSLRKTIGHERYQALCQEARNVRLRRHDADGPTEPRQGPRQGSVLAGAVAVRKHIAIPDETGGWRASEKLLHQLSSEMKWTQSPRIFAKKNSEIMPILKGLEDTVVIIPYQEGTWQTYEVIDHLFLLYHPLTWCVHKVSP